VVDFDIPFIYIFMYSTDMLVYDTLFFLNGESFELQPGYMEQRLSYLSL